MKLQQITLSCSLVLLLSACGGSSGDTTKQVDTTETDLTNTEEIETGGMQVSEFPPQYSTAFGVEQCSIEDINARVDFAMRDYYVYYDQVPNVNLNDYDDPDTLIRDLRVDPDIYSSVADAADQNALLNEGRSGGFGFWFNRAGDGVVRFRDIQIGSPAFDEGILRGDEVLEMNNISIEDITDDEFYDALDPDNAPVNLFIRTASDEPRSVLVDFADYNWKTVGQIERYENTNSALPVIGYLPISIFLGPTQGEIDLALEDLQDAGGFDELIVDLRYNPGGFIRVAKHIASVVGGAAVENEVFYKDRWNDKYAANNNTEYFDEVEKPLNMPRVFVLVTQYSASASEMFINTLKPYIDVVVIGGVTGGKPFTSQANDYCGKSIFAMHSLRTNSVGVSVAGGIQPDCVVSDNWETPANSVQDPLVNTVLNYMATSTCPVSITDSPALRNSGKQELSYRSPEIVVPEQ